MLFFVRATYLMDKLSLRKSYLHKRKQLSYHWIEQQSLELANQLLKLPIWNAQRIHLFLSNPQKKEVNTEYILTLLQGKDKEIIVPKMEKETELAHFLLTDQTRLSVNKWGIPEPQDGISIATKLIEVVFVPLLAFDLNGHRIGYGKGYYDRFLADCTSKCLKIGLSFFPPSEELIPVEKTDIALDYCVTPEKIYSFI